MPEYIAHDGQTLLDVALQLTGSLDYLVELAAAGGVAIEAELRAGQAVAYGAGLVDANATARYLRLNGLYVVTAGELLEALEAPAATSLITRVSFPQQVPAANSYAARANQSSLDMALQLCGDLHGLVALCAQNRLSVSQLVPVGATLTFDKTQQMESTTAAYLALNGRSVVTWVPLIGELADGPAEYEASEYEASEYA